MVFEGAGQSEGLEIWRIEDFQPVPYPTNGKFHTGDSYIILNTKDVKGKLIWSVHFWLGNETTQDESGAAAMLTVELDDTLGGAPVQYREVQGAESTQFLSYFPQKSVYYLPGGVQSGFKHYDPDQVETRMFKVKGKKNIRVEQVEVSVESMNKSDCFILDTGKGKTIFVFMPPGARRSETFKATLVANQIRDEDHAGNSDVVITGETSDNLDDFFAALGAGSIDDVKENDGVDDEAVDKDVKTGIKLYVLDGDSFTEVGGYPLKQDMLDPEKIFLVSSGGYSSQQIFLWMGQQTSKDSRLEAMKAAEKFAEANGLHKNTNIVRVLEGLETAMFKQYFSSWVDASDVDTVGDDIIAQWNVEDLHTENRKRMEKAGGSLIGFYPDNGSGEKKIWRVEESELVPVNNEGFLFGGDSYVILYMTADGKPVLYYWQGKTSTTLEKGASAALVVNMDNQDFGGNALQIRVVQGEEPRHFLNMFDGQLIIFAGGKETGFNAINDRDEYDADGARLFRIRSLCKQARDARAEQVDASSSSLDSDDVFLLETQGKAWLWKGKDSSTAEADVAWGLAAKLCPDVEVQGVSEGSEDDDFWAALGGQQEYNIGEDRPFLPPRLFHVVLLPSGGSRAIEIFDFKKEDMIEDDVMILDTGKEIIVWIGKDATSEEREAGARIAGEYLDTDPTYRNSDNTVIMVCKQDHEPEFFHQYFKN